MTQTVEATSGSDISWPTVLIALIAAVVGPLATILTQQVLARNARRVAKDDRDHEIFVKATLKADEDEQSARSQRTLGYRNFIEVVSELLVAMGAQRTGSRVLAHRALTHAVDIQLYGSAEASGHVARMSNSLGLLAHGTALWMDENSTASSSQDHLSQQLAEFVKIIRTELVPLSLTDGQE
ncbi:hypothetical protein [Arthrobacter sp. H16F315]|uniref:hypothetical protein n=1 Tax=Arthrobacter sp. H16F315 TaxID=2955314 RepID=UPI002096B829|nr:hypothetical protein [Arthrobacter sp. H16F315]MDD1478673.1 hypothetical protein [Arthrobacter sp. H16F315]